MQFTLTHLLWLLLISLSCAMPHARANELTQEDPNWFVGLPVALATVVAAEGSLDEKDPSELLLAKEGVRLNPQLLHSDLSTLYRLGQFAAVEVVVNPWVMTNEEGNLVRAVNVEYRTYQAPRLSKLEVQGHKNISKREVIASSGFRPGDIFYPDLDVPRAKAQVTERLQQLGFPGATVEVDPVQIDTFSFELWIRVDEGVPEVLSSLSFEGAPPSIPLRRLKRWARRGGLRPQKPINGSSVSKARFEIRKQLAKSNHSLFKEFGSRFLHSEAPKTLGWVEARVQETITENSPGQISVAFKIDSGARFAIQSLPLERKRDALLINEAIQALEIDERLRLTRGFVEQSPERIERWLKQRGFHQATAQASLERDGDTQTLVLKTHKGPRFGLGQLQFSGNETITASDLRRVMKQASPDILRKNRYARSEITKGMKALEALYISRGYLQAVAKETATVERGVFGILWWPRRRVDLWFNIDEGPVTTLGTLEVVGAAPDVDNSYLSISKMTLEGRPHSPQTLALLTQRIVSEHQKSGYLDVDARMTRTQHEGNKETVTIEVTPGPKIILRSFSTQGNSRVNSRFLRRLIESELRQGDTVTTKKLTNVREKLYGVGMFSSVQLRILGDDSARDLVAELREHSRHAIEGGFGVSTDEGIRTLARYSLRNVFSSGSGADSLEMNSLIGFDFNSGPPYFSFNSPEIRLGMTYATPIKSSRLAVGALFQERVHERTWKLIRSGGSITWEILGRDRRFRYQFLSKVEMARLEDADPGSLLPNEPWSLLKKSESPSLDTLGRWTDSLSFVVIRENFDNPLQPSRGMYLKGVAEFSPSILPNQLRVPFIKVEGSIDAYIPVGGFTLRLNGAGAHARVVPLGRVQTYTVTTADGTEALQPAIPLEARYRLGGTSSLRGFRRGAVGPLNQVRRLNFGWSDTLDPAIGLGLSEDPDRWVPTGGDTKFEATAEFMAPFPALGLDSWDGYWLIAFADVGNTWLMGRDSSASSLSDETKAIFNPIFRYGVGIGLRIDTPVGPIQGDLGFNPERMFGSNAKRSLLRDQWREPAARLHLSFGTLF